VPTTDSVKLSVEVHRKMAVKIDKHFYSPAVSIDGSKRQKIESCMHLVACPVLFEEYGR